MNDTGTTGNLLYSFYDLPLGDATNLCIQTKATYNLLKYLSRRLGGDTRLHTSTQYDNKYGFFEPGAPPDLVLLLDLEQRLLQEYNAPRDVADWEALWRYINFPEYIHPRLGLNFGTLAKEAEAYADYTLSEAKWNNCKRPKGAHLVFNFERLISCLEEYSNSEDILVNARRMQVALELSNLNAKIAGIEESLNAK